MKRPSPPKHTLGQLRNIAADLGIRNLSSMTRAELEDAVGQALALEAAEQHHHALAWIRVA